VFKRLDAFALLGRLTGYPCTLEDMRLEVYSPYSTAPAESIPGLGDLSPQPRKTVGVRRTIQTDEVLADLLIYELGQRIPDLMDLDSDESAPAWIRTLAAPLRLINFIPPHAKRCESR